MLSNLKALKVADLRRILADAGAPAPARATKADLVARITDNDAAQLIYQSRYNPQQEQQQEQQEQLPEPTLPTPAPPSPAQEPDKPLSPADAELEKRKARAARFGIPLVATPSDDKEKLQERAKRFGVEPPLDAEELERRRKRAERFGTAAPVRPFSSALLLSWSFPERRLISSLCVYPHSLALPLFMSSTTKYTDMGWPEEDALWKYSSLTEPLLTSELARLSFARSTSDTDSLSFQPCPNPASANQDRYVVQQWQLPDGLWSFRAVFDGHAGHATADYAVQVLPDQLRQNLQSVQSRHPDQISKFLVDSIIAFDDSIAQDFLRLVPDPQAIAKMTDDQLRSIIDDLEASPERVQSIKRCMHGSTALIALLDPPKHNLWVASLGDCQAALGRKDKEGKWSTSLLSAFHNGCDAAEVQRIRQEHPGEAECVHNHRVLGAIAVTRALGDHEFKLPPIFTERVFARTNPGFSFSATNLNDFLSRNHTPPYLSNRPDVRHVSLADRDQSQEIRLIMCSDGLLDLYSGQSEPSSKLDQLAEIWFNALDNRDKSLDAYNNLALALLRHALGGSDTEKVSRNITVEMQFRWMDDTTILVQRI
ncbi:protein serine/threonine phosphatase 2C [Macrolepiota fuliginosa MF-IS2]|uniref:Protein serine/threonine phosphatase 2C n=1 Tax=Macrolepiota fuliginosa MF-IS2 TaxID=1400762 RepID=A0A9P5XH16_9AGAR|nr:protein serine/threonine phosphatase 2C [Macrolepiota fuliginosa MF-IS2]